MIEAFLNSVSAALNAMFGGVASRHIPPARVVLIAAPAATAVATILVLLAPAALSARSVVIGSIAGISGGLGIYLSYRALARGPIGPVAAIIACTGVGLVSTVGLVQRGGVTWVHALALALCLLSVVMVSVRTVRHSVEPRTLAIAIAAGGVSGSFSILMDQTSSDDGWWPLFFVRVGVVAFAIPFAYFALRSRPESAGAGPRWVWLFAAGAGVMDALGNMFLILALREIDLASLAIFAAVTPALTALISFLVVREPITFIQAAGVGLAAGAIWLGLVA